jgi:hypothetical protein
MAETTSNGRRTVLSAVVFAVFCLLAGASDQESAEDQKTRIMTSENVTGADYDARVRDFGSYEDYKTAVSKGMSAAQYRQYKTQKAACHNDWRQCADNEQLVNEWSGWTMVQVRCKSAANDRAKYGDPEWPWLPFGSFFKGKDYVAKGKAVAVEPDAKFQNGFGAKLRVRVTCFYDLAGEKVENVLITER